MLLQFGIGQGIGFLNKLDGTQKGVLHFVQATVSISTLHKSHVSRMKKCSTPTITASEICRAFIRINSLLTRWTFCLLCGFNEISTECIVDCLMFHTYYYWKIYYVAEGALYVLCPFVSSVVV